MLGSVLLVVLEITVATTMVVVMVSMYGVLVELAINVEGDEKMVSNPSLMHTPVFMVSVTEV